MSLSQWVTLPESRALIFTAPTMLWGLRRHLTAPAMLSRCRWHREHQYQGAGDTVVLSAFCLCDACGILSTVTMWRCCWCYCRGIGDAKHLNSAYLRSRLLSRPRRPLPATMPPLLQYFDCSSTFSLPTHSNFFPILLDCIIASFKCIYY